MHRGGREGGANYLQVDTKDTLEDQVGLSISMLRLASRCGIQLASLKEICFLFQMQLSAKFLVIFQLTIGILGVLRRQRIPLPTNPHTGTGVIGAIGIGRSGMSGIGSSNCSKSNNSSSNVGRPELAQSYTNLGLTQDSGMEGTMKNLTFLARYGGCAIAKKACVRGVCRFGRGVQPRHLPMHCLGPGCGGQLGTTVVQKSLPSRGSPPLQSGGGKSEVAYLWAKWLRHPCRLGDPRRFRAGGKIRSPPTCGQSGYVTPAASGIPTASERGGKSEVAHLWAKWLRHPCRLGDPHRFRAGGKSEVAHLWARWLRHPYRLGDPHRCRASVKVR